MSKITLKKRKNGSISIKATGLKSPSLAHALATIGVAVSPVLPLLSEKPIKEKPVTEASGAESR